MLKRRQRVQSAPPEKPEFYMDDDIAMKPTIAALRTRGVEIAASDAFGMRGRADESHLAFCDLHYESRGDRQPTDFGRLHNRWLTAGRTHAGIVIVDQRTSIGDQIRGLAAIHDQVSRQELADHLCFLSAWIPTSGQ